MHLPMAVVLGKAFENRDSTFLGSFERLIKQQHQLWPDRSDPQAGFGSVDRDLPPVPINVGPFELVSL